MSAFASLILFIIIAVASMALVAYTNYRVEQEKKVRHKLQQYKTRVEELEDVVLALDQLCNSRTIPKIVNDEVVDIYEKMMELDSEAGHLKAGHSNAKSRSEELSNDSGERHISRLCNSDAQIARLQAYLNEACSLLKKKHNRGKIETPDLQRFVLELEWLYLQVYVISNIAQGHKAYSKQDILTANAFYKKAQTELMRSGHPDERRHKMIKQLADILFGHRKSIDKELMPEDEFNPDNDNDNTSPSAEVETDEILVNLEEGKMDPAEIAAIQQANQGSGAAASH